MIRRPPRSTQSRSSAASDVYKRQVLDHAFRREDRVGPSGLRLGFLEAVTIALAVLELQRVGGPDLGEEGVSASVPEQKFQALDCGEAEMETAFRAHAEVAFDLLQIERFAAPVLSLIHISEPTRLGMISYAV